METATRIASSASSLPRKAAAAGAIGLAAMPFSTRAGAALWGRVYLQVDEVIDKPFQRQLLHTIQSAGYRLADLDAESAAA